jgi:alpha,alpha-trehalose phosphorylase
VDLLVQTARLWRSLGHYDAEGRFRIDGVTGPDEYSALADNNVYTNLMAEQNLRAAADVCVRHARRAGELAVSPTEIADWRAAASAMFIPWDERLGVHPQADGFTDYDVWDFEHTPPDQYPLLLHAPYFELYRKQVVKQADLVLAMQLRTEVFTEEQKARNFEYYERITVRDSSLSASTQAVIAAEVGHTDLAYDYLAETALLDLHDLQHNTRDGVHLAALAGTWFALVGGFGGLRAPGGKLCFTPRLPAQLQRLRFTLWRHGCILQVTATPESATYTLLQGRPLDISHHAEQFTVSVGAPVSRPIPPAPVRPRPKQPPGREPVPRSQHP